MNPQDFNNYLANVQANAASSVQQPQPQAQPQSTQQPQQQGGGGNWFTHLLPTAGGILGGIVGGAADVGSLGLLAPVINPITGAAVGGALGQAGENAASGKNPLSSNDLTSGLESGVGELAGGVAGKVLGKGADLLASKAGAITDASKAAADSASDDQAALDKIAATKNNYGGIKPGVQSSNNLQGNMDLLDSYGVDSTDPQAMQNSSKGGLFINNIDENALQAGSPIKTSDLISSKDITTASPEEQQALVNAGIITPEGRLPATVTPVQANKFAQDLNGQMRSMQGLADNAFKNGDVVNYNAANGQLKDLTDKYNAVQKLASTPEVDATIAARTITPEEKAGLVEQYGQSQADAIEKSVNEAQTHADLVKAKLPYAQMNTLSKQALSDMKAPATARGVARGKMGLDDGTAEPERQTPGITHAIASGNGKVVPTVLHLAKNASTNPTLLNTLSRMGALTAKVAPTAGVIAANAGNMGAAPVAVTGQQGGTMGAVMQPQQNPLDQLYQTLLTQYNAGGDIGANAGSLTSALAGLAPQVQKQNLVAGELSAIPGQFANAGGAQGTGGILSRISGLIPGTAANNYQNDQTGAAQALAAQLGISPQAAMGLLPQLMNNQATAGQNTGVLSQLTGQLAYQ